MFIPLLAATGRGIIFKNLQNIDEKFGHLPDSAYWKYFERNVKPGWFINHTRVSILFIANIL